MNQQNLADFIWSLADVLCGDFRQSEFGRIILPTTAGATFYNVSQFALDSVGSKGCLEVLRESLPYPHPQP